MAQYAHIKFANEAIDALDGNVRVAELFGLDERVISNWRLRGLPPHSYAGLAPLLTMKGMAAPPDMFRQLLIRHRRVARSARKNGNR